MIKVSFEDYANQFSDLIVRETYNLIRAQNKEYGVDAVKYISTAVISKLISLILLDTLQEKPAQKSTRQHAYDFTHKNFNIIKNQIQDSVASAFSGAMMSWAGKNVEYYCQVKTVPEPTNTKVC